MMLAMKAVIACFALFLMIYMTKAAPPASDYAHLPTADTNVLDSAVITSCDELLQRLTVGLVGTVFFASPIECTAPATLNTSWN